MANDPGPIGESEFLELLRQRLDRRRLLGGAAGAAAGAVGAGMLIGEAAAAPAGRAAGVLASHQEVPADAAPADKQILVLGADGSNVKVLDFYEQVYERGGAGDLFSEPLVRLD